MVRRTLMNLVPDERLAECLAGLDRLNVRYRIRNTKTPGFTIVGVESSYAHLWVRGAFLGKPYRRLKPVI